MQRIRFCWSRASLLAMALACPLFSARAQAVPQFNFARPDWTSREAFTEINSVRELAGGNVIVADDGEIAVLLLDAAGGKLAQVGRKGSGPAEYLYPLRLIALPKDTTMIIDRDARKFLLVNPLGKIVESHPFPAHIADVAESIRSADGSGRLYFRGSLLNAENTPAASAAIARWKRGSATIDTLATIVLETSGGKRFREPGADLLVRGNVQFAAVDDWAVASTGRVAMIRATPYRVDWVEPSRSVKVGTALAYQPIPVTEADKKRREPKGPPFLKTYAKVKSPFMVETAVVDSDDNVWVARNEPVNATVRRWDIFSTGGKHLATVPLPAARRICAITKRFAYVVRTDEDGLRWLERYSLAAQSRK